MVNLSVMGWSHTLPPAQLIAHRFLLNRYCWSVGCLAPVHVLECRIRYTPKLTGTPTFCTLTWEDSHSLLCRPMSLICKVFLGLPSLQRSPATFFTLGFPECMVETVVTKLNEYGVFKAT